MRWFSVDGAKLFHFCAGQLPTTINIATTILFPYFKKEFTPHTPLSLNDKVIRYIVQRHTKQNERIEGLYNNKRGDHVQMNSTIARYTEYCFQLHNEEWIHPNVQSKLVCIKRHFESLRGKQEPHTNQLQQLQAHYLPAMPILILCCLYSAHSFTTRLATSHMETHVQVVGDASKW